MKSMNIYKFFKLFFNVSNFRHLIVIIAPIKLHKNIKDLRGTYVT